MDNQILESLVVAGIVSVVMDAMGVVSEGAEVKEEGGVGPECEGEVGVGSNWPCLLGREGVYGRRD